MRDSRPLFYEPIERPRRTVPLALLFVLLIGLVAGSGLVVYGMFVDRSRTQVPVLVSGFMVLGFVFVALAAASAVSSVRSARDGRGARAVWIALLGGLMCLAAAGNLGAGVVLALLYGSTPGA
jgi:hypothetical protein